MHPSAQLRAWVQRVLRLGPARLALGLSILLALIALALPLWSVGSFTGNEQDIGSFSWNAVTTDRYQSGVWTRTTIVPYSSSGFVAVGGVLGTAYVLDLIFALVSAVVFAVFSLDFGRRMPLLSLLVVSLIVVGVGLLAILYPIVAIPGAATTDVGTFTIGGFWGGTTTPPATRWSWGAGLGWWLLLAAVVLGIVGAALPYLKSVRATATGRPRAWRPSG